jgi:hypothetical protein
MSPRGAILAGLSLGILVAVLIMGGIYFLAPEGSAVAPTPSPSTPTPTGSPSPGASQSPATSPVAATPTTSGSVGALSHIGELAPVHFWIDVDGVVRDGALGGIVPDVMARGVGTILPGVTVTP